MFAARMALDGAGLLSKIVQLGVAQFVNDAFGFLAEDHWVVLGFLRSSRIDFVYEPFVFGQFALHPSRLHREQFLQLWGRLSIQAFLQQMNLSRSSWILHWLFLHQVPRRLFPAASRCTFRSVLLLLLAFAKNFGVQSLVEVEAIWWHRTAYNNGIRPCLPEL